MILVTGGMGFIGLHTARELLDAGEDLVLTRYHVRREPDFLAGALGTGITVETLDTADSYAVFDLMSRHDIDSVIHLAVPALGRLAPAEEAQANLAGLLNVLEAARIGQVRRVTLASSVAVYTGAGPGPWREDTPLPVGSGSPTGAFKKMTETVADHYAERTGLDVALLRIGFIYGPLYHSMSNLPSRLAHAAVRGRDPGFAGPGGSVPLAGDGLDYCYVKDCARAIALLHLAGRLEHRIYNVGGGRVTSNAEISEAVAAACPAATLPELVPGASAGTRPAGRGYMDLTRIRGEFGYEPAYQPAKAIADYCGWLSLHEE